MTVVPGSPAITNSARSGAMLATATGRVLAFVVTPAVGACDLLLAVSGSVIS